MSTASTKLRHKPEAGLVAAEPTELSDRAWTVAALVILFVAAVLRFYNLDLVPLHHDEGVNGNFLVRLVRDGFYHYDPANYHGPSIYYFAALYPRILRALFGVEAQNNYGLTTTAIRCVTSLFGLATVALIFTLRRNLGKIATLSAAALLAISPGAVYLSRYFIHETLFVFFTLGIVVAVLRYYESGRPIYLLLASASAALLFATKETAIISVAVLAIALVSTIVYRRLTGPVKEQSKRKRKGTAPAERSFLDRAGGIGMLMIWALVAFAIFVAINVLLYSSFFTNYPKGVSDALSTFQFWTKTGKEAHVHPFITYVWWLMLQESPLFVLGVVGALVSLRRSASGLSLFISQWAFGLIAAYSLIAYKTPWLALNFVIPLALASGVAMEWLYSELRDWQFDWKQRVAMVLAVLLLATGPLPAAFRAFTQEKAPIATAIPGYQTLDLNFKNYDNDDRYYVYVYAHTRRELLDLLAEIDKIAERTHQGNQTGITIVSPDYWPMPWYLRNYNRVGYFGRMSGSNEPIIIASQGQVDEVNSIFGDRYQLVHSEKNASGSFALRPGVDLLLYTKRELVR